MRRFVAKIIGSVKADKPAKLLMFPDGAEVAVYVNVHPRAKKSQKHIHLHNPKVKFEVASNPTSSSSPASSTF